MVEFNIPMLFVMPKEMNGNVSDLVIWNHWPTILSSYFAVSYGVYCYLKIIKLDVLFAACPVTCSAKSQVQRC